MKTKTAVPNGRGVRSHGVGLCSTRVVRLFDCLILSVVAAFAGCQTEKKADDGVTRVLMIGNSFSISCMTHLPAVAEGCGVPLDLCSLYIPGCSLERHWNNVQSNAVNENIRQLCFSPGGILFRDFDQIFCKIFGKKAEDRKAVLKAVAYGSKKIDEIPPSVRLDHALDFIIPVERLFARGCGFST